MNVWIPAIITIVVNIVVVAFAFGKLSQSVSDIKEKLGLSNAAEIVKTNRDDRWKERMEDASTIHIMLPSCIEAFEGIRRELSSLSGKVDTLIGLGGEKHG
jgi:hypothetical protein